MKILNQTNYKKSGLDINLLEELEASISAVQKIWHDIKVKEAESCEDESIETIGDYIKSDPDIWITAYNHNDEIRVIVSENAWDLRVKDYNDYMDLNDTDIEKAIKEINFFLRSQNERS